MARLIMAKYVPLNNLRSWLGLALLALMIIVLSAPVQAQDARGDLLGRINGLRSSLGLAPYSLNGALDAAAANHAQWMSSTGQVSHVQYDGSSPRDRARVAGYGSNWVSENIYMGSMASADSAWNFWVNSGIHYAGLTNPNYSEVGIGVVSGGSGTAFVLVFGSPAPLRAVSVNPSSSAGSNAAAAPPSFVVGVDANGNIMHEIQPADTLGDIALIYGYTWDDLPYMLELNSLTWDDIRVLKIGSVLLVPPYEGTFTPTPVADANATPEAQPQQEGLPDADAGILSADTQNADAAAPAEAGPDSSGESSGETVSAEGLSVAEAQFPTASPTFSPSPTPEPTRALVIRALPVATATEIADSADSTTREPVMGSVMSGPPLWLLAAIVVQLGLLGFASLEYFRRNRK